jgi:spore maturation protein CgeB
LVWAHHGRAASNQDFLNYLHRHGVRTAVYLCDEPYEVGETAKYSPSFKFVFTMDPCTVEVHRRSRERRSNVFYLPPAADVAHFKYRPYWNTKGKFLRGTPAFFLGNATLIPRKRWLAPVQDLVEGADIRFFGTVGKGHPKWVGMEQHPTLYGGCTVGLNVHRDPAITKDCFKKRVLGRSRHDPFPKGLEPCQHFPKHEGTGFWNDGNLPATHINPRFLEMASCGTLVVSDDTRPELARLFPMAPRASDPGHFLELVQYYIDSPREAERIGQACSSRILERHSYQHRAAEVLIRVGLLGSVKDSLPTYLGEPEVWLSPQDCSELGIESFSDPIGPSERWSPAYGLSLTQKSGSPKDLTSIDAPNPFAS